MGRTKALKAEENETLRELVRRVLDAHFPGRGGQTAFSDATGLSQPHISGLLNDGKGGGIQSLRAIAKFKPVEVVQLLHIRLETLVGLWSETEPEGVKLADLPEPVRRAARAAVELYGCTPDEAHAAALKVLARPTDPDEPPSPMELLIAMKPHIPPRSKSGVRRKSA